MSAHLQEILRFCEAESAWVREAVEALVRLESPCDDKAAVDRCGAELAERLAQIGAEVTPSLQTVSGDHLRARWFSRKPQKTDSARPQILLLGHFDTVWPVGTLQRMPLREEDGRLHGPGSFDMKSGIAVAMLAIRALDEV